MRVALQALNAELQERWGVHLGMRTGLNTGEVVASHEGFVVGDAVNVAARLEQAAAAGEVLVGETTWRLTRHEASFEAAAALTVKGKEAPLPVYRLLAATPAAEDRGRLEAPLIGREEELARLHAAFTVALDERACRLVTIVGSPGMGKTRLAQEFAVAVADRATVVEGRCEPSGEGITFLPVAEVLRDAAGIGDDAVREVDAFVALQQALAASSYAVTRRYELLAASELRTAGLHTARGRLVDGDGEFEIANGVVIQPTPRPPQGTRNPPRRRYSGCRITGCLAAAASSRRRTGVV